MCGRGGGGGGGGGVRTPWTVTTNLGTSLLSQILTHVVRRIELQSAGKTSRAKVIQGL